MKCIFSVEGTEKGISGEEVRALESILSVVSRALKSISEVDVRALKKLFLG